MTALPPTQPPAAAEVNEIVLQLVDHLDAMVAFWDINQVCVFANNAYQKWFGKTRPEIVGHTLEQLLGPVLYAKNLPYVRAAYAGQVQVFEREIPSPTGMVMYSLATYTPYIVAGQVRGIFVHVADVTPLKKLEWELQAAIAKAEQLATHDFLTGLPNRVLLLDRMTQALAAAQRKQQWLGVLSLDLDNLKEVNDTYGHAAGDAMLVEVAGRLSHGLRACDTVTRTGGDEFVLLAPEIETPAELAGLAERVLQGLRPPLSWQAVTLRPAASIGVALFPQHGATPETLLANSDCALYTAKKRGGDQYAVFDPAAA